MRFRLCFLLVISTITYLAIAQNSCVCQDSLNCSCGPTLISPGGIEDAKATLQLSLSQCPGVVQGFLNVEWTGVAGSPSTNASFTLTEGSSGTNPAPFCAADPDAASSTAVCASLSGLVVREGGASINLALSETKNAQSIEDYPFSPLEIGKVCAHGNCMDCTADSGCGWCATSFKCVPRTGNAPVCGSGCEIFFADSCDAPIMNLQAGVIVFTVVGLLVGLVFLFYGYRLVRWFFFLTGFTICGGTTWIVVASHSNLVWWGGLIAALAAGIAGGLILLFVLSIGIFLIGALAGFILSIFVLSLKEGGLIHGPAAYVFIVLLGIAGGLIALWKQKPLLIVSSSFLGSYAIVAVIDRYTSGSFSSAFRLLIEGKLEQMRCPWVTYVLFATCFVLTIIGSAIQWNITGKKHHHRPKQVEHIPLLTPGAMNVQYVESYRY